MALLGLNQTPIETMHGMGDAVQYPQTDKNPPRTDSRRRIAAAFGVKVWRAPDFLMDGYPGSIGNFQDYRRTAIRAFARYLIDHDQKAVFVLGGSLLPNSATYRAATGGDAAWAQVNFADWNMHRLPTTARQVRWDWQRTCLDYYKAYFVEAEKDWSRHIEIELINEPSRVTTPTATSTTVNGSHSAGAATLNVASSAGFAANHWVTIQGSGAWQSFQVDSVAVGALNVRAGTCSSNYGNTKSNGLVVDVANGVTVTRCQYRGDSDYFGVLDSSAYDEMDYESENVKNAFPEIFLWGPGLAGGHPDSIDALFASGRAFLDRCDGFNYHAYSINPGRYVGDEQWYANPAMPDDIGELRFAASVSRMHERIVARYREHTSKPLMCSEWGLTGGTAGHGTSGHRSWTPQKFSHLLASAIDQLCGLQDVRNMILWAPDRAGLGNAVDSMDLMSAEASKDSSATFYMCAAKAMRRTGTPTTIVPSGFANSGAQTGVA